MLELCLVFFVFEELVPLFLPDMHSFTVFQSDVEIVTDLRGYIDFESLDFPFNTSIIFTDISFEKLGRGWEAVFFVAASQKRIVWVIDQLFKIT